MRGKLVFGVVSLLIGIIGGTTIVTQNTQALDSSRDCDKYAVVYCGTMSTNEIRSKYSQKDHARVFSAFGISKSDISGDIRSGVVYRDGRVVVGGKTVATGAVMAARNLGGSGISGTNAKKLSVSNMGDNQTAFVKFDKYGRFAWAIMKPCGNPVAATPTKPKPTPPKPQPKPAAVCQGLVASQLSRSDYKLTAKSATSNGATISGYSFVVKNESGSTVDTGTVSTKATSASYTTRDLAPGSYTATVTVKTSVGNKSGKDCIVSFTVEKEKEPIKVCELKTKAIIMINEEDFDSSLHSRDYADCKEAPKTIEVCEIKTKTITTINEDEFDSNVHSRDFDACKETPVELPKTGLDNVFTQLIGVLSLTAASAYYLTSKR